MNKLTIKTVLAQGIHKDKRSCYSNRFQVPLFNVASSVFDKEHSLMKELRALSIWKPKTVLAGTRFIGMVLIGMICDTNLEQTHGRCHLDGNQMRINLVFYCCVFRKRPSLLQRKWLYLDRWNQQTVFHLNSGSNVWVYACETGTDWSVAPILECLRTVFFFLMIAFVTRESCAFYVSAESDARPPKCNNIQRVWNVCFFVSSVEWKQSYISYLTREMIAV